MHHINVALKQIKDPIKLSSHLNASKYHATLEVLQGKFLQKTMFSQSC